VFTASDVLWGIIAPAVLAAVAMVLAYVLRGRQQTEPAPWGATLAIAGGFVIAYVGITGVPRRCPPRVAQDWLVLLSPVPLLIAVLATIVPRRIGRWVAAALSGLLIALTAYLLLRRNAITVIVPVAILMAGWWIAMESLASRVRGATLPLLLSITSMSAAAVLMDAGVQPFAQYAAAIGFSLGAITLVNLLLRGATLSDGGMLALAVLLLGLLICGYFFSDVSRRDAILLALAPSAAWAGELPQLSRRPLLRFAVRSLVVLIVLSIPLVPAIRGLERTLREQTNSIEY
jgi:hypothetical protein